MDDEAIAVSVASSARSGGRADSYAAGWCTERSAKAPWTTDPKLEPWKRALGKHNWDGV